MPCEPRSEPTAITSEPTRSDAPLAVPCSGGLGSDQSHALPCGRLPVPGHPLVGAVWCAPLPADACGNSERPVPRGGARRSRGEAGRGRGAGPSARGAGGACDHAARGRASSAARWRRRGEQWRPRPPERRVRSWTAGRAAGVAGPQRAGQSRPPPARDRSSLASRSTSLGAGRGPQVSALSGRGRSQTMGAAGGLLPSTRDRGRGHRAGSPRRSGIPDLDLALALGAWAWRGRLWTLPEQPARGVRRLGSHSREPADGQRLRELAESVGPFNSLFPSRAAGSCPGVPGSGPGGGAGPSETSPSGI